MYEKRKIMGSVAFLQDLSEIKHLQKELLMSERLSTIGQTVAGMAHGIKNILHGFKGGSYIMEVGFKNNDNVKLKKRVGSDSETYIQDIGPGDGSVDIFKSQGTRV